MIDVNVGIIMVTHQALGDLWLVTWQASLSCDVPPNVPPRGATRCNSRPVQGRPALTFTGKVGSHGKFTLLERTK